MTFERLYRTFQAGREADAHAPLVLYTIRETGDAFVAPSVLRAHSILLGRLGSGVQELSADGADGSYACASTREGRDLILTSDGTRVEW